MNTEKNQLDLTIRKLVTLARTTSGPYSYWLNYTEDSVDENIVIVKLVRFQEAWLIISGIISIVSNSVCFPHICKQKKEKKKKQKRDFSLIFNIKKFQKQNTSTNAHGYIYNFLNIIVKEANVTQL